MALLAAALLSIAGSSALRAAGDSRVSFIALPIVGFHSDLGFQYGGYIDLFDPARNHYHLEVSHYTKGQTFVHGEYDSSLLIPGVRFVASATWQHDPLFNFYGFNGSVNTYNPSVDRKDGLAYYCYKRDLIRVLATFQGIIGGGFSWMGGLNFRYMSSDDLNFKGYDSKNTLFNFYRENGLIRDNELHGFLLDIIGGLKFDTRDLELDPRSGVWAELFVNGSPDFFGTSYPYLKAALRWRHYLTPFGDWLTLAYHLGYQSTVMGDAPFYMEQNISTIQIRQTCSEGLGGINTVRGVMSNRLIGRGYAWANVETRLRIFRFQLLKNDFVLGLNPFFDVGCITSPMRVDETAAAFGLSEEDVYSRSRELHPSAGIGAKVSANGNFVFSVEFGKPFRAEDGLYGLYFALNYVF
ncbi:MAG: BamA/TamA family outer membrane protein [Bacteroidales bacterium]|nr:BamA/TamA family outer membrane protein [Bacteroidales bacterium]